MDPNTPVEKLTGVGKYYAYKLKKLEIETLEDLIYHFPFRYDDFSSLRTIANVQDGEVISIQAVIWKIQNIRTRNGKFITVATVADQSGTLEVVWFNQSWLTKTLKAGMHISLSGKAQIEGSKVKLLSPSYEILRTSDQLPMTNDQKTIHTARLVSVYPETEGLNSKWLRAKISQLLPNYIESVQDFLPDEIIKSQSLAGLKSALQKIHLPQSYDEVQTAKKRLAFDEIFQVQVAAQMRKINWKKTKKAPRIKIATTEIAKFIKSLPFTLTGAQEKSAGEIIADLSREIPANRLLEGDVGSGKTVVAALAAYAAVKNGFQVLIAAPTEILAFQHTRTLKDLLGKFDIEVGTWTGSKKEDGQVISGTHALLQSYKAKKQVGLVIVDEQHRFGVAQRGKLFLQQEKNLTPHLLTMTATPIPRTLALTMYGDLDLSVLDEMPKGRQKIETYVVPNPKRQDAYKFIEKQITDGRQAFIITPFVEPSETMTSVKAATVEFEKLKNQFSKSIRLGLLHGRLKSKDKEKIIESFKKGMIDILVSTPVVEVGIDVANAAIMMIESADRFGLAQLHQLRGRVGRGEHKSYCLLFTDSSFPNSVQRLKSMQKIDRGFELAEIDLKMRGSGEIFGLRQSGFLNFKIADLSDTKLIASAQNEAKKLLETDETLKSYPSLKQKLEKFETKFVQPN